MTVSAIWGLGCFLALACLRIAARAAASRPSSSFEKVLIRLDASGVLAFPCCFAWASLAASLRIRSSRRLRRSPASCALDMGLV